MRTAKKDALFDKLTDETEESTLEQINEARKLKLKSYPALMINDNLESEGRIVSTREIMKMLKRYE